MPAAGAVALPSEQRARRSERAKKRKSGERGAGQKAFEKEKSDRRHESEHGTAGRGAAEMKRTPKRIEPTDAELR